MASATKKVITLKSCEKESFEVEEAVILQSQTIKNMIEDGCADDGIPLPSITSEILSKVIDYCKKHHVDDQKIKQDDDQASGHDDHHNLLPNDTGKILAKVIGYCKKHDVDDQKIKEDDHHNLKEWDAEFVKVDQTTLFDLILAANYLDIKNLLELTCQTVADMIMGKTAKKIRITFNIENDFTPEEEEEIKKLKKENLWAFL